MGVEIPVKDPATGQVYLTNPCRDVAWFMPQLMQVLAERLAPDRLTKEDHTRLAAGGVQPIDLAVAYAGLGRFMNGARDPALKTPQEDVEASGFNEADPIAQQIVLEHFARTLLGGCWAGIRSSVMPAESPPHLDTIISRSRELLNSFSDPPIK